MDKPINELSFSILGCAMEVHRHLGPGMLESTYKLCLEYQLMEAGFVVAREVPVRLQYKDLTIERAYFIDLLVEGKMVLELKAVEHLSPEHEAQVLTYIKHGGYHLGFLMNFNSSPLKNGTRRFVHNL